MTRLPNSAIYDNTLSSERSPSRGPPLLVDGVELSNIGVFSPRQVRGGSCRSRRGHDPAIFEVRPRYKERRASVVPIYSKENCRAEQALKAKSSKRLKLERLGGAGANTVSGFVSRSPYRRSSSPYHLLIKTTTNPPAVKNRSWFSEYMLGHSSASAYTGSGDPPTIAEMKDKVVQELKHAIFTVNLTAQGAPLQADSDDVQKVFDHLQHNCGLTYMTLFGDDKSTKNVPRLPLSGFGAASTGKSYEPLTHLLNTIVHAANICLTHARYLKDIHFDPHGVEMQEKLDSEKPLKPDILGLLHSRTPDEPEISWNDVAVFIEVNLKSDLIEVVKQLATYAHRHLAVDRRRSFSIAIAFSHKALTFHFLCFHRSGISISPPLHIDKEGGFRSVVEHMVGILSIRDEEAFGLDMTRVKNIYRLNDHNYGIVRTIHERNSICSHSTVVYSLKRAELSF